MTAQDAIDLSDERIEKIRNRKIVTRVARWDGSGWTALVDPPDIDIVAAASSMGYDSRMAALLEECEGSNA